MPTASRPNSPARSVGVEDATSSDSFDGAPKDSASASRGDQGPSQNHVTSDMMQSSQMSSDKNKPDYSQIYSPAPVLATSRYNRQMLIPSISLSGQQRIQSARVLIIGLGGLGSPTALYLAGAGIGKLGLLDDDTVELSNLHRQIVHREDSVQRHLTKVESAVRACRELNANEDFEVVGHETRMDVSTPEQAEQIMEVVEGYDIVLDCTDNPATRYLISDLCVVLGKVLVSGAAQRLEGQIIVLNYPLPDGSGRGPCYRCVFPTPPSPEMVKGCGEIGILGPVVGTIGCLMATEALRLVVKGEDETRKATMLLYSAWPTDPKSMFRSIGLRGRRSDCVACGDEDVLRAKGLERIAKDKIPRGSMDYATFCGRVDNVKLLRQEERVDATEFLHTIGSNGRTPEVFGAPEQRKWHNAMVIDTREPYEIGMGPQLRLAANIPISRILRGDSALEEIAEMVNAGYHDAVLFVCQQGNDSQVAAKRLMDWNAKQGNRSDSDAVGSGTQKLFVGDITGGFAALDKV